MAIRKTRTKAWATVLAGLFLASSALAETPISENAKGHFNEGVRYLTTREPDRYERAYAEFQAAYADSPSWKILGNLGIVAQELERDGEAIDAYREYLRASGKELTSAERKQFTEDLARLELRSAKVVIQTIPEGAWIVDERLPEAGKSIVNRYGPTQGPLELRVRAGHHRIHAELSGNVSEIWDIAPSAGTQVSHTFELQRADVPSEAPPARRRAAEPFDHEPARDDGMPTSRILGYTALGLGALGAGAGTWFMIQQAQTGREGDAAYRRCVQAALQSMRVPANAPACPPDQLPEAGEVQDSQSEQGAQRTLALVGFSAAGALLTTGVLLLVYGSDASAPVEDAALQPWFGMDRIGVAGRF